MTIDFVWMPVLHSPCLRWADDSDKTHGDDDMEDACKLTCESTRKKLLLLLCFAWLHLLSLPSVGSEPMACVQCTQMHRNL